MTFVKELGEQTEIRALKQYVFKNKRKGGGTTGESLSVCDIGPHSFAYTVVISSVTKTSETDSSFK